MAIRAFGRFACWDRPCGCTEGLPPTLAIGALVAGLDHRYAWSSPLPAAVQAVALAVCSLGYALVVWATASNAFFSLIVRSALEDLTLQAELPGYPEYVLQVRQRLVPGLW